MNKVLVTGPSGFLGYHVIKLLNERKIRPRTLMPEDFVGAPANGLVMRMTTRRFRFTAPIGFGILDVRDYAGGVLRAVENGRHGQRYLLSGENIDATILKREVAAVVGIRPPWLLISIRVWMVYPLITMLGLWSRLRRKPPRIARRILQLWSRHAWYDTSLARRELGWQPRPLRETLKATIVWLQNNAKQ